MRFQRIIVVVLMLFTFMAGCASDRAVIGQADQFHSGLERAVMNDRQLNDYFNRVGRRIIAAAKQTEAGQAEENAWMFSKEMEFHLVNSKQLNAFTTGGEHMYIYNELFQQSRTEDELAAVMAHEFAHVFGRHVHKGMNRQLAIMGAAGLAGAAGYAAGGSEKGGEYAGMGAGLAMLAGQFVGMSYTRRDESEADSLGFEFYTKAGWDPEKFGDFFQSMIDKGYDKGPDYLSDHPSLKSRLEAARQRAERLETEAKKWRRPNVATSQEFKRLQQRAEQLGKRTPTDESLVQTQELLAAMPRSCLTPAIHEDQKQAEVRVMRKLKAEEAREQQNAK